MAGWAAEARQGAALAAKHCLTKNCYGELLCNPPTGLKRVGFFVEAFLRDVWSEMLFCCIMLEGQTKW